MATTGAGGLSNPAATSRGHRRAFDTNVAHIARVYDYWLGGKDNYAADREAARQAMEAIPSLPAGARANRAFLGRSVRYLAAEAGIRQFLDIGTGIPTSNNTHEVAQTTARASRIVYVDNDPIVLSHARALLTGTPQGATAYVDADLRDTGKILAGAAATLDFGKPIAIMLVAILHCIPDSDDPQAIVARLLDAVVPGSYLVISHPASDIEDDHRAEVRDNAQPEPGGAGRFPHARGGLPVLHRARHPSARHRRRAPVAA